MKSAWISASCSLRCLPNSCPIANESGACWRPFHAKDGVAKARVIAAKRYDGIEPKRGFSASRAAVGRNVGCRNLAPAMQTSMPDRRPELLQTFFAKGGIATVVEKLRAAIGAARRKEQIAPGRGQAAHFVSQSANPANHSDIINLRKRNIQETGRPLPPLFWIAAACHRFFCPWRFPILSLPKTCRQNGWTSHSHLTWVMLVEKRSNRRCITRNNDCADSAAPFGRIGEKIAIVGTASHERRASGGPIWDMKWVHCERTDASQSLSPGETKMIGSLIQSVRPSEISRRRITPLGVQWEHFLIGVFVLLLMLNLPAPARAQSAGQASPDQERGDTTTKNILDLDIALCPTRVALPERLAIPRGATHDRSGRQPSPESATAIGHQDPVDAASAPANKNCTCTS